MSTKTKTKAKITKRHGTRVNLRRTTARRAPAHHQLAPRPADPKRPDSRLASIESRLNIFLDQTKTLNNRLGNLAGSLVGGCGGTDTLPKGAIDGPGSISRIEALLDSLNSAQDDSSSLVSTLESAVG